MKHFKTIVATLLCVSVLGMMSCATLFANKTPEVRMASDPDGAKVYVNGDLMGTTPVKLQLATNKTYQIMFKKDGYADKTYILNNHAGGVWIVLDILGGLIPIVIDAATGAWYEFDSQDVKAMLEH